MILPTFSEGLPMVILEAWAAGTPVIMSEACNLPEGFAANAAMACATTPDGIALALENGFSLDEAAWLAMARAAQGLAKERFSAASVARRWERAYTSLLVAKEAPD